MGANNSRGMPVNEDSAENNQQSTGDKVMNLEKLNFKETDMEVPLKVEEVWSRFMGLIRSDVKQTEMEDIFRTINILQAEMMLFYNKMINSSSMDSAFFQRTMIMYARVLEEIKSITIVSWSNHLPIPSSEVIAQAMYRVSAFVKKYERLARRDNSKRDIYDTYAKGAKFLEEKLREKLQTIFDKKPKKLNKERMLLTGLVNEEDLKTNKEKYENAIKLIANYQSESYKDMVDICVRKINESAEYRVKNVNADE